MLVGENSCLDAPVDETQTTTRSLFFNPVSARHRCRRIHVGVAALDVAFHADMLCYFSGLRASNAEK